MLSFFPYAKISEAPPEQVLDCALYVMYRWGYIKCFRIDNGQPLGDPTRQSLTPCALNLIARGCQVLINPPRSPIKNAKVERCQGTTGRWSDAANSANIKQFGQNLEYAVIAQRQRLPTRVCQGLTRAQRYPALFSNPRRYNPQDFDLQRVIDYLSKGKWYRTINKVGQVQLFGKRYQAGFQHRRKKVFVFLQLEQGQPYWCCYDQQQQLIAKFLADNLANGQYLDLSNM